MGALTEELGKLFLKEVSLLLGGQEPTDPEQAE